MNILKFALDGYSLDHAIMQFNLHRISDNIQVALFTGTNETVLSCPSL